MNSITFTAPGTPRPKGSWKSIGKGRMIPDNKRAKGWEETVAICARSQYTNSPPTESPVVVDAIFRVPRPRSHYGTGKNADKVKLSAPAQPTGQRCGDIDKLLRTVLDAMTGIVYKDDSQVVQVTATKRYAKQGSAVIKVAW